jgi:hypothetical protein
MKTLLIFTSVIVFICVYIIYYHKIDTYNFLDVIHTGFVRQFVFELIPFIILFGVRDMKFIDISNTGNFFGSLVGRSILGMIGFTFVSYAITTVSPKKNNPPIPLLDSVQNLPQVGGKENLKKLESKQILNSFTNNLPMFNNIDGNEKLLSYYQLE